MLSVQPGSNYIVRMTQLTAPDLYLLGQTDVTYPGQRLVSCLFVYDYVYQVYPIAIRATFCMTGTTTNTDFPLATGDSIHSLFKFQSGWIIGFGQTSTYQSFVNLYKISVSPLISLVRHYILTIGSSSIGASFWNPQGFLINPSTNTIVFNLYNYGSPAPPAVMSQGLYYLYVHTNSCIAPGPSAPANCPPSPTTPPFGYVYKHYSSSSTYQTGIS